MSLTFDELFQKETDFKVDANRFRVQPSEELINNVVKALEAKNHRVSVVADEKEALELLKKEIPDKAEVMAASSATLAEIGFKDYYFSNDCKWVNVHKNILSLEPSQQGPARSKALASQYFLSSVTAISQDGNIFVADASGTRVGGFTASQNMVIVAGVNKLVQNDEEAIKRTELFCLPCESVRARWAYKNQGSVIQNLLNVRFGATMGNKYHIILIRKLLGY
ncbi:hypothetical protein CYY_008058 [Polysphondylium violaceum]|uniref:LUD domain-containing protein n=1 Tax=Polysphondylium violaceum TaxID=133409 RepID=A0A8J4V4D3_9MYCE|nr:hypothetical protein CYY_008058 [Polysphondylium violaceum]